MRERDGSTGKKDREREMVRNGRISCELRKNNLRWREGERGEQEGRRRKENGRHGMRGRREQLLAEGRGQPDK